MAKVRAREDEIRERVRSGALKPRMLDEVHTTAIAIVREERSKSKTLEKHPAALAEPVPGLAALEATQRPSTERLEDSGTLIPLHEHPADKARRQHEQKAREYEQRERLELERAAEAERQRLRREYEGQLMEAAHGAASGGEYTVVKASYEE